MRIMVLEAITGTLQTKNINLPFIGGASIATLLVAGAVIYFLSRRKKSISLKI